MDLIEICSYLCLFKSIAHFYILRHNNISHPTNQTLLHIIPRLTTHMNRQKKKVSHSSDDDDGQVSIFDSEEEAPKEKKSQVKGGKSGRKAGRPVKNKVKKATPKSREKKLSKDQDDIMKKLLGQKQEVKSRDSTESDKKEHDEIKFEENYPSAKREQRQDMIEDEMQEESNPYEEIPFLDEYSATKDNITEPYNSPKPQITPNRNLSYLNGATYSNKLANTYFQINPQQPQRQSIPYPKQKTYTSLPHGYNPPYTYPNPQQQQYPSNSQIHPLIDPSLQLNLQDFQQINFDQIDKLVDIHPSDIEQLRQQVDQQKKTESHNVDKRDKKYRKRRMNIILAQIQKLKKEYIQLENLNAESEQAQQQRKVQDSNMLKQWKYDPNLLRRPQKPKLELLSTNTSQDAASRSKTQGRIIMLNEVLTENPFLTQVEMADVLRAMDPVMNARIERSVVLRLLKMCGFKKKKVRGICKERNTPLSLSLRCEYARKYREYAAQGYQMFYLDQLIINEYFDKESGWCKAEEQVEFRPERFIDRSVVVVALLSSKGTCNWNVRFGNYQPEEYCKTFNNLLKASQTNHDRKLLIVNPLSYRDPKVIMDIADKRGWDMLVLPTDGLGLNPLQSYFVDVRDIMKRKRYDTIENLFQSVVEVLQDGDKQGLVNKMLGRVETYVEKSMRREPL